jgi:S-adenosylmethionine:diacylglycerol 3-amino-3-carboxypropyl transferase
MAHLIFKGHLRNMAKEIMPPSLQKHVLKRVGERLREGDLSLDYYHADLADVMSWQTSAGPTLYSLSDILSFEDHGYLIDLLQNIAPNPKHIVVIRSFLRNRLGQAELDSLSLAYHHVAVHDAAESTGMYQIISLSERMPIEHKKNGSHAYTFHTV